MVRMKDIAQLAGVNITTVSKALRGSSDISKETSVRIWELAKQLGYQSKHAKKEKSGSNVIRVGFVCHAAGQMTNHMVTPMQEAGYEMVVFISGFDVEKEKSMVCQMDEDMDGIIYLNVLGAPLDDIHVSKPLVVIGPELYSDCYDVLKVDEISGYRQAIDHLVSLGHKRFGFIGDRFYAVRLKYIRAELERRGLELPEKWVSVEQKHRHLPCGYYGFEKIAKQDDMPTAILAQYDDVAYGAIERMRELGIRVPEDMSVVGYDGVDYCNYLRPKLSSICGYEWESAKIATGIMKKKIQDPQFRAVQTVEVKAKYIARESVGPAKTE